MKLPHHVALHASFIVRISAERMLIDAPDKANDGAVEWAIHGWMVLVNANESWRFTDIHDLPVILTQWLEAHQLTQHHGDQEQ